MHVKLKGYNYNNKMEKEIKKYLEDKKIEATIKSHGFTEFYEIHFKIYDCDIALKICNDRKLDDYLKEANSIYLEYLKRQHKYCKEMAEGFNKQIEEYVPILS